MKKFSLFRGISDRRKIVKQNTEKVSVHPVIDPRVNSAKRGELFDERGDAVNTGQMNRNTVIRDSRFEAVKWSEEIVGQKTISTATGTTADKEEEKHTEKDKKFLYREITLSSAGVIFYAPIYASQRRRGGGHGTLAELRRGKSG